MLKYLYLFFVTLALVNAKPLDESISTTTSEISSAEENADAFTSSAGLHFGDRLPDSPTTPKDAADLYSLSYLETSDPDHPVHDSAESSRSRRDIVEVLQQNNDVDLNKSFFDSIFQFTRAVRGAGEDSGTIPLDKLVSAVESTLVHSAQNLAIAANLTNSTTDTVTDKVTTDLDTTSAITKSVLSTQATSTEKNARHIRSVEQTTLESTTEKLNFSEVKPLEKNQNLELLSPIVFTVPKTEDHLTTTTETSIVTSTASSPLINTDHPNITIIQTINATQYYPTADTLHVQTHQLTLFSANAGVFPDIPSVPVEHFSLESLTDNSEETSTSVGDSSDCSESSDSSSTTDSLSNSSSEENDSKSPALTKCSITAAQKSATSSTSTTSTEATTNAVDEVVTTTKVPSAVELDQKHKKAEELKEKIAEVEATPVILTQGI